MAHDEPTNFIESNLLLAEQAHDREHVRELLETMLPGELQELRKACERLAWACHQEIINQEERKS